MNNAPKRSINQSTDAPAEPAALNIATRLGSAMSERWRGIIIGAMIGLIVGVLIMAAMGGIELRPHTHK